MPRSSSSLRRSQATLKRNASLLPSLHFAGIQNFSVTLMFVIYIIPTFLHLFICWQLAQASGL
jgi:hypothetical protein